jgi:MFS family permease
MLSHAGKTVGRGWSYGVQEALSSVGGMIGPIIIVAVMLLGGDYRLGFEILLLPCALAVVVLFQARKIDPHPGDIKDHCPVKEKKRKFSRTYWIFLIAGALIAAGYADFPMISYHISTVTTVSQGWIPILYALSMATNALAALVFGRMYDKIGIMPLVAMAAVIPFFAPLVFASDMASVTAGMLLYGVGFGAQDSAMRAMVADISPHCRRGMAFGCYNTAFGLSWFLGSVVMGVLYDVSLPSMIMTSMVLQFAAIPLFLLVMREELRTKQLLAHGGARQEPAPEPPPMPAPATGPGIALEVSAEPPAANTVMAASLPEVPPPVSPSVDAGTSSEAPAPEAPASPQ